MSTIINIESSAAACSVAVSADGAVEFSREEREPMHQSTHLAPFVAAALEEMERKGMKADAVAVSIGPGSYTGLRIGMSLAKGLCFGLDVPLIGVNTLKLLAVKTMFRNMDFTGTEVLVPMIDARRMEVYTAAYDFALNAVVEPQSMIIDADSFGMLDPERRLIFMGDGAGKTKEVIGRKNAEWIDGISPRAYDMVALAEKAYRENDFLDLAYSTPFYIKDYNAIKGENPLTQLFQKNKCK